MPHLEQQLVVGWLPQRVVPGGRQKADQARHQVVSQTALLPRLRALGVLQLREVRGQVRSEVRVGQVRAGQGRSGTAPGGLSDGSAAGAPSLGCSPAEGGQRSGQRSEVRSTAVAAHQSPVRGVG